MSRNPAYDGPDGIFADFKGMDSGIKTAPPSVFDVLDHLQRPEDQLTWIGIGASDALRNFDSDPEQYTSRKARACYRLGYYLMKRTIEGRGLPGEGKC